MPKTGAREVGLILLGLWALATIRMFLFIPSEAISEYNNMYGTMTLAIFTFVTSSFGMKVYSNVSQYKAVTNIQPRLPLDPNEVQGAG